MTEDVACTNCNKFVCNTQYYDRAESSCPTIQKSGLIKKVVKEYEKSDIREFAYQACKQHNEGVMLLADGWRIPINPRVEEIIQFVRKMGYNKIGLAFCSALRKEAKICNEIFEKRGLITVSVCCMVGGIPVTSVGLSEEDKINGPESWQTMCNPIVQAEILNEAKTDFNVALGLCIGHDSLFFKYAQAPTTVLVVKDRVFGHNPVAALYQVDVFYRWLMRDDVSSH
jgi:uncharacterized metal-binding protein